MSKYGLTDGSPCLSRMITTPNNMNLQASVNELITSAGSWKVEVVRGMFRDEDVNAILAIPLDMGRTDLLWWHFEQHSRHLVRSGYRILKQGLVAGDVSTNQGSASGGLVNWNFIWKVVVPPKVRLFIWRACRNLLPTSFNLQCRGGLVEGACPWCGIGRDDLLHTLIYCHFTHFVWALSNVPWETTACLYDDPEVWFRSLHRNLDRSLFCRAFIICWLLWWRATSCYLGTPRFQ
ncbi:UNVERIFIED_CONTAM: hypothetical protein Sradi_3821900 [Sesamum radiatum]|uniref:Reverse transcriptase zinc-binding domain-containing protein n=1 Tax=Sesamum radiatum TaxID=300843 RepID=A0AAW2Q0J6_SESRA